MIVDISGNEASHLHNLQCVSSGRVWFRKGQLGKGRVGERT